MIYIRKCLLSLFLLITAFVKAEEGMWLPFLLESMNEKEMKAMGMKINAKDIYSVNNGSLKDAIVSFGGFCTGEVISTKGLLLTNHHCGFNVIQNHSTLDRNYIRDGFWAKTGTEELINPSLFVTFIVRIEDVTKDILQGLSDDLSEGERQSIIDKNINAYKSKVKKESYQDYYIRPFFEGNQYCLFITETYNDVRLVGAPPSSIGNFGKDTDNWMWPRHTGDFAVFRIYAGKDNKPANYSPDNIPYTPKKSLSISLDGVADNDFTFVFGFPGRTMEYLHSAAVQQTIAVNNPAKIAIRDKALAVIDNYMRKDEQIKIQYAAKYASISNAWKKWQGEILGLTKTKAVDKKKTQEAEFQRRVLNNAAWKKKYGNLLAELQSTYDAVKEYGLARDYFLETTSKIEIFTVINQLTSLVNNRNKADYTDRLDKIKLSLDELYKEYNAEVDAKLFESLMEMYAAQNKKFISPALASVKDFAAWTKELFAATELDNGKTTLQKLLDDPEALYSSMQGDRMVQVQAELVTVYQTLVLPELNRLQQKINGLQRDYMKAQLEVMKEKKFYPDANSTLRVTYGNVKGYNPKDAVTYDPFTYLDGAMEKYIPGDYEFDMPEKLLELYKKKDYGIYGKEGKMPVCFIASNHTTGGNSGSPALDAHGNLVGINFDRVWEGTMSDINYDPSICRNIMVDIRYVLFIIDKYAGASHLIQEMKLVRPKTRKP